MLHFSVHINTRTFVTIARLPQRSTPPSTIEGQQTGTVSHVTLHYLLNSVTCYTTLRAEQFQNNYYIVFALQSLVLHCCKNQYNAHTDYGFFADYNVLKEIYLFLKPFYFLQNVLAYQFIFLIMLNEITVDKMDSCRVV